MEHKSSMPRVHSSIPFPMLILRARHCSWHWEFSKTKQNKVKQKNKQCIYYHGAHIIVGEPDNKQSGK